MGLGPGPVWAWAQGRYGLWDLGAVHFQTISLSLSLSLCICELKNIKKIDMHVNNNQIYLHDYCSNNLNLNVLIWVIFEVKCAKFTPYAIIHRLM